MKVKKFRKGDMVEVRTGKDAGRRGEILRVLPYEGRAVVEGINVYKKHIKGDGNQKESAIIDITKSVDVSNLRVVCSNCGKGTRVGVEIAGEKKVRVCKKCGKEIAGAISEKPKKKAKKKTTTKTKKSSPKKKSSKQSKSKAKKK